MYDEEDENITYHRKPNYSRNGCGEWLKTLMLSMPPRSGETRETLVAKLSLYVSALEQDNDLMDGHMLLLVQRKFKWFPAIADLAEVFDALRKELKYERKQPPQPSNKMHVARINSLARLAMRDWWPPSSLQLRERPKWEAWALGIACQAVRDGRIDAEFKSIAGGGCGYELTTTISAPIIPDPLYDEWIK